jgi:hypothetical protein
VHANGTIFRWTTDLLPPSTLIKSQPVALSTLPTAEFSFGCSDGEGKCTFRYLVDSAHHWQTFGLGAFVGPVPEAVTTAVTVTKATDIQDIGKVSSSQGIVIKLSTSALTAVHFEYRVFIEGRSTGAWMRTALGKAFAVLPGLPNGNHTLEVAFDFLTQACLDLS